MNLNEEAVRWRDNYQGHLQPIREQVLNEIKNIIREDIEDPRRTGPNADRELYMLRANQVGIGILRSGLISLGVEVYQVLIDEIKQYRERTGNWRHLGTLYANLAAGYFVLGNTDDGIFLLLQAADEDYQTARVPPNNSYALTDMLRVYFVDPVINHAVQAVQRVEPNITPAELEALYRSLGDRGYVFLAYLSIFRQSMNHQTVLTTEYNYWQMFSALRNLSAVFEVEVKTRAHLPSLSGSIRYLYGTKPWWLAYETAKNSVGESPNSPIPSENRLNQALLFTPTTDEQRFWKSLLIAFITRNYTVHQMDFANILPVASLELVLGHILHALATASRYV